MTVGPIQSTRPEKGRRYAWPLATLGGLAGAAVIVLWWFDPRQAAVPFCAFHAMTGLCCPGCGALRASHELLHGRVLSALSYNALWILGLPLVFYATVSEARYLVRGQPLRGDFLRHPRLIVVLAAVALVFCLLRNIPLHPFTLLGPPG